MDKYIECRFQYYVYRKSIDITFTENRNNVCRKDKIFLKMVFRVHGNMNFRKNKVEIFVNIRKIK